MPKQIDLFTWSEQGTLCSCAVGTQLLSLKFYYSSKLLQRSHWNRWMSQPLVVFLLSMDPQLRSRLAWGKQFWNMVQYDTIVVGLGGHGSAALYQLAQRGHKVVLWHFICLPIKRHGRVYVRSPYSHPSLMTFKRVLQCARSWAWSNSQLLMTADPLMAIHGSSASSTMSTQVSPNCKCHCVTAEVSVNHAHPSRT